jgi:glutamyl-Q tRNA(Asp) synthetase
MVQPVFRFAPSPNGRLHLGHAYSALLNAEMARSCGGRLLVRIEDIDRQRCKPEHVTNALEDLHWLGLEFEQPVLFQSERFPDYRDAIARLMELQLLYVCTCTRQHLAHQSSPHVDPEGQPIYPGTCRRIAHHFAITSALRLRMDQAVKLAMQMTGGPVCWREKGKEHIADPTAWGDVVLARKDIGTSYHLAVVIDDAFQGVTHVVRGEDLFHATAIHRVLQVLLELPEPDYHHHALLRHGTGRKLSKSRADESLADLRSSGISAAEIRAQLGIA